MKPLPIVSYDKSLGFARSFQPLILHGFKGWHDWPVALGHRPGTFPGIPTMYYCVRKSAEKHPYVMYALYHPWDEAAWHWHDFEGILVHQDDTGSLNYASVSHLHIRFERTTFPLAFFVEADGHGITPLPSPDKVDTNHLRLCDFDLQDLGVITVKDWQRYKAAFAPTVKMPDEWHDLTLEKWVQKVKPTINGVRLTTTKGLFWDRPDLLFAVAEKRNLL